MDHSFYFETWPKKYLASFFVNEEKPTVCCGLATRSKSGEAFERVGWNEAEYTHWLHEAGFVKIETAEIGSHSPLIIAHKQRRQQTTG